LRSRHADFPQPSEVDIAKLASRADTFGVPFSELETTPSQLSQPFGTSNLNNFDEAFGKISNGGSAQPTSAISFDSIYKDNFDFGTAMVSSSTFPPPPTGFAPANGILATTANVVTRTNGAPDFFTQPASNGTSATPRVVMAQPAAPVSFDEVFSSGPWNASSTAPQPEKAESKQADAGGISFQDAFGGVDVFQDLAPSKAFTCSASPPSSEDGRPFPNVALPCATSPSPRAIYSKLQRPLSFLAKDVHHKPPPPPRHSKLSVCTIFTSHGAVLIIGAS
jgi:epidermal growth factor receptor substrate 15